MELKELKEALFECYSKDLCYKKVQENWTLNNKCFGMCAITSLLVQDYFCGDICKIHVNGISHYFNLVEGKIIDLTASQFTCPINYENYQVVSREKILTEDTNRRYTLLKEKLRRYRKSDVV